jgi:hypothetical protein
MGFGPMDAAGALTKPACWRQMPKRAQRHLFANAHDWGLVLSSGLSLATVSAQFFERLIQIVSELNGAKWKEVNPSATVSLSRALS